MGWDKTSVVSPSDLSWTKGASSTPFPQNKGLGELPTSAEPLPLKMNTPVILQRYLGSYAPGSSRACYQAGPSHQNDFVISVEINIIPEK